MEGKLAHKTISIASLVVLGVGGRGEKVAHVVAQPIVKNLPEIRLKSRRN